MSFRIFISGNGGYNDASDNNFDSSTFDLMKILGNLQYTSPDAMGAAGMGVSTYVPSADSSDAMLAQGTIVAVENIRTALNTLAMCSGVAAGGSVSLSCTNTHPLWPDTVTFSQYNFQPGTNPGYEFMQIVGPDLNTTGLNTLGVLFALGNALNKFANSVDSSATPMVNIQLSH